jgi:hypothetical protein
MILCFPRQAERALLALRNLAMQVEHHALFKDSWSMVLWQVRQRFSVSGILWHPYTIDYVNVHVPITFGPELFDHTLFDAIQDRVRNVRRQGVRSLVRVLAAVSNDGV